MLYGLIGEKLGHSFSKELHNRMGNENYILKEIAKEEVDAWLDEADFEGINVTIPYKEVAFRHCIPDENAKAIGCVNTLIKRDGKLYGYNTDIDGFLFMVHRAGITVKGKKVVIFGNGGTAKTAAYAAHKEEASQIVVVSRRVLTDDSFWKNYSEVKLTTYENIDDYKDAKVIFNTTPVGMYPDMEKQVVNLDIFEDLQGVVDVIYNPSRTSLIIEAQKRNIPATTGLSMLVVQAQVAEEIWQVEGVNAREADIEGIVKILENRSKNIVVIGMPGSGKSTVGKSIANKLGRDFLDTDEEFEKEFGIAAGKCIVDEGEPAMRDKETEIAKKMAIKTGTVISTGGGLPIREENRIALKHNGFVVFVKRDIDKLATAGRPLSAGDGKLEKLYNERLDKYMDMADVVIDNNDKLIAAVEAAINAFEAK